MSTCLQTDEFPIWALVPKKETGVTNFLDKYPYYDGRGVTIAIFDSGVDPGAPGLQVTTEGKPKIIGRYDCSGAGDVDTSTIVYAGEGNVVRGLSGRSLVIPATWKNPSGKFHIGIKNAFELYTKNVQKRIEEERKEKLWDPCHKSLISKSIIEQQTLSNEFDLIKVPLLTNQKLKKEDNENTVEALQNMDKKYKSISPVYDCIVFNDGIQWYACMDTSETGDLSSCKLMGNYSDDPMNNFDYITATDHMTYSFNIRDDGNLLEIVSLGSSHGTHVSAIAAGYFPGEPEKNGVAPGAQIISLTIGDSRLETMETGTSIVRAMIKVMQLCKNLNIDVINMSYGEHSNWSHAGRIGDIMNDVVDKHRVTWVASAGNHGPALCTIGAPPDISKTAIIGVGAYVSPDMMTAEYSMLKKLPGTTYTWSSRGPTIDGGRGVSVCAPGGAIASVPGYMLRGTQLMNGTSMSAPHVAGAAAILISGLKAKKIDPSPYLIKRSMENTALYQDKIDHFSQGHGLLQVEKAFNYMTNYFREFESYIKFNISCGIEGKKGIHVRNAWENKTLDYSVTVEPVFLQDIDIVAEKKIEFQLSLCLISDVYWVSVPKHLELMYMPRNFNVKVDPSGLDTGVHTSTVRAYDSKNTEKGPVFTFEVTIVRPLKVRNNSSWLTFDDIEFNTNSFIKRHFILVPSKVTWASIHIKHLDADVNANFCLHTVQLLPQKSCKHMEYCKMFSMKANHFQAHFPVEENVVMECALAKYWSSAANTKLSYKLQFNGNLPSTKSLAMYHGMGLQSLTLKPGIKNEEISPAVSLKHLITVLKPTDSKVVALSETLPPQIPIYSLTLTYTFSLLKSTEAYATCGLFGELLYECEYESQLWMLFDNNKQYITAGDAYSSRHVYKLDKGDYTIKMHVRHDRRELLEKIIDLPIQLVQKLQNHLSVDVYTSHYQATIYGKKLPNFLLTPNSDLVHLFVGSISNDKITSLKLTAGQCLSGNIVFAKDENGKKVDTYDFKYFITDASKNQSKNVPKLVDENKTKLDEFNEVMCETKSNWLTKLEYGADSKKLYDELCEEFGNKNSSVHISWIQCIEPEDKKKFPNVLILQDLDIEKLKCLVVAADCVLSMIDQKDLLAFYGIRSDQRPEAAKLKTVNDRLKANVIEALCRKGAALCQLYYFHHIINKEEDEDSKALKSIDEIWVKITFYISPDSDLKNFNYFNIWYAVVHDHYGRMMKILLKMLDDKNIKEVESCLLWTVKAKFDPVESKHLTDSISNALIVHYPKNYRLF